jgi:hypothetical protein
MAVFRRRSGFSASTPLKCGIRTRGSPAVANGLAVTSLKRSPIISELPTLAESGFPDFEAISWFGLLAPAGTPAAVVGKVHADIVQIAVRADMRERIAQLGLEPSLNSPEEFAVVIKTDTATSGFIRHALCAASRWAALVLTGGGFDLSEA